MPISKKPHAILDTCSPKLSQFLAAQERTAATETELAEAEARARNLRMELTVARREMQTAQQALEALDPQTGDGRPDVERQPRRQRGRGVPDEALELLLEIGDEVRSLQELEQLLPHVDPDELRARIIRARSAGLIQSGGGRGKYCLSEAGQGALEGRG